MKANYSSDICLPFKDASKSRISHTEGPKKNLKVNPKTHHHNKNSNSDINGLSSRHSIKNEVGQNDGLFSSETRARQPERAEFDIIRDQLRNQRATRSTRKIIAYQTPSIGIVNLRNPCEISLTSRYLITLKNNQYNSSYVTQLPSSHEPRAPLYGVDKFLTTFYMFISVSTVFVV